MLQVRRPAFIELTMLSRYEARVRFDAFLLQTFSRMPVPMHDVFFFFNFRVGIAKFSKELLTDFFINLKARKC